MVHQDTVELLRECDAGTQMGVASIADVLPHVQSGTFRALPEKPLSQPIRSRRRARQGHRQAADPPRSAACRQYPQLSLMRKAADVCAHEFDDVHSAWRC